MSARGGNGSSESPQDTPPRAAMPWGRLALDNVPGATTPVPMHIAARAVESQGERWVLMIVSTENSVQTLWLTPDAADAVATWITDAAKAARSGLVIAHPLGSHPQVKPGIFQTKKHRQ